ncbi:unnamed protein product, partial [Symbiodinium pilosum]
ERLNDFRMAMDELLAAPEQETADTASRAYEDLMLGVEQQKKQWGGTKDANMFFPDADYNIQARGDPQTQARLVTPPCGCLELYEVGGQHAHPHQHARPSGFDMEAHGEQATFRASPPWLRSLSALARHDLEGDLEILASKFSLTSAELVEVRKHGLPAGLAVDIAGPKPAVEAARRELVEGILQYYGTQVEWSAAELPTEPDEEPPTRETPAKRVWIGAHAQQTRPLAAAEEPAPEAQEEEKGGWGEAPMATEVGWDAPAAEDVSWGADPGPEAIPGLFQALSSVGLEREAAEIARCAEEMGAVSVKEVADNVDMLVEEGQAPLYSSFAVESPATNMAPLPVVFLLAYVVVGVAAKPASVASPHEKAAKGKVKECCDCTGDHACQPSAKHCIKMSLSRKCFGDTIFHVNSKVGSFGEFAFASDLVAHPTALEHVSKWLVHNDVSSMDTLSATPELLQSFLLDAHSKVPLNPYLGMRRYLQKELRKPPPPPVIKIG